MATLEIHDQHGQVTRTTIDRDSIVLFGSNPRCELPLTGPGVLPFHGRIRWKKDRYKVDASPDAQFVVVNGREMKATSLRAGDEIEVGENRIFLLNDHDDDDEHGSQRVEQATVVLPSRRPDEAPPALKRMRGGRSPEFAPPSVEEDAEGIAERARRGSRRRDESLKGLAGEPPAAAAGSGKPAAVRGWRGMIAFLKRGEPAPGEERIGGTPLVIGLLAALVVLIIAGVGLRSVIKQTMATRQYTRAMEDFDAADYRNALRGFDVFLESNASDPRAAKAKVLRALSNVKQFASTTGGAWGSALDAAEEMVETVGTEKAYRDSAPDLDEVILKAADGFAKTAASRADPKSLAEAERAVKLHRRVTRENAEPLLIRAGLPGKLDEARAAIEKSQKRAAQIAAMDAALKSGSAGNVYEARDRLVEAYGDLATDAELLKRMTSANDLIRKAATYDETRRPASTTPRAEPFPTRLSLVPRALEAGSVGATTLIDAKTAPVVFAIADGTAYGLASSNGAPLWQRPVGAASRYAPLPIPGARDGAIVFDARHNELLRIKASDGALVWRLEVGEPLADPPLLLGNQAIQATPTGKLLWVDLNGGELLGTLNLGRRLAKTPVADELGEHLFILAESDVLFVVARDPPSCLAVEYLGHNAGAAACAPQRLGRYLVAVLNDGLADGHWRVMLINEEGTALKPVQTLSIPGWSWGAPAFAGSTIWATADRGAIAAYAVGSYEDKEPLRLLAGSNADAASSGPAYAHARSETELWLSSSRTGKYDLDMEKGVINSGWTLVNAGRAVAPMQVAGASIVLSQQNADDTGVAMWGVNPRDGKVRWRTTLGGEWALPLQVDASGKSASTLAADGAPLRIDAALLRKGGFVAGAIPGPGRFRLPKGASTRLEHAGVTVVVPGPGAGKVLVRGGTDEFKEVDLPAPLAADPIFWGDALFVATNDGRAYLLDPRTGESRSEPFAPPFDRDKPTRWLMPALLDGDAVVLADDSGRMRRLVRQDEPRPRIVVAAEVNLGKEIVADPVALPGAVVAATIDGRIRALALRDLSPQGSWTLEAPLATPPAAVEGKVFIADESGGILALGPDGRRLWSIRLSGPPPFGPPVVRRSTAWFLARDGRLEGRALADGAPAGNVALGVLPAGPPFSLDGELVVPVGPGAVAAARLPDDVAPRPAAAGPGAAAPQPPKD